MIEVVVGDEVLPPSGRTRPRLAPVKPSVVCCDMLSVLSDVNSAWSEVDTSRLGVLCSDEDIKRLPFGLKEGGSF